MPALRGEEDLPRCVSPDLEGWPAWTVQEDVVFDTLLLRYTVHHVEASGQNGSIYEISNLKDLGTSRRRQYYSQSKGAF